MEKISWDQFRSNGFLWLINCTLHIFGLAIVVEVDNETGLVTNCYPAKVPYRGFDEADNSEGYIKISEFMKENAERLQKEASE